MLVGILGDLGRDSYLPDVLDGVASYQLAHGRAFDLLLQVGDVSNGAHSLEFDATEMAEARRRHEGTLPLPIHFVRGNHDALSKLQALAAGTAPIPVESPGVLAWVMDGTVLDLGGVRVGFTGGADVHADRCLDPASLDRLRAQRPIDVLVSHDGPVGLSKPRPDGTPVGDPYIGAFVQEPAGPALVVFGHYHVSAGPRPLGRTTIVILAPAIRPPADGSLGVLDCRARKFWVAGREEGAVSMGIEGDRLSARPAAARNWPLLAAVTRQ